DNKTLGVFHLDGIAPAPRGVPKIEVTYDIDANGIVNVSAKDMGTGKEQHITITSQTNMSKEDIDRAVREAETHAEEDKKIREAADARNQAEQLVYQSEKTLSEIGDKLPAEDVQPVRDEIERTKEALKGSDTEAIKSASDALTKAFYAVSEKLYKATGAAPEGAAPAGGASDAGSNGGDNGYYDANYEVKDDDNNK
ncbi:MAG: Hsp70 family protein, partial [Oscillospiraceae bacterium]|nr:Hsp70 family protein [Oscillospiraceae bacterium]